MNLIKFKVEFIRPLLFLIVLIACKSENRQLDKKMEKTTKFFQNIYNNFNERKIDFVIDNMTSDVKWANGMDGGFVYGHNGVREYWTRQFTLVSSKVTPMEVKEVNGEIQIKVHQVVHDLSGKLLADEVVTHIFRLDKNKIAQFDIQK
jgi:hypothetical protein